MGHITARTRSSFPPPPSGPTYYSEIETEPSQKPAAKSRPRGHRFEAEIEVSEMDDRQRPGLPWPARTRELSRSGIVMVSRRMCYPNRLLLLAVHRIDDRPVPLFSRVVDCEYEADGLYRVEVELLPIPQHGPVAEWALTKSAK